MENARFRRREIYRDRGDVAERNSTAVNSPGDDMSTGHGRMLLPVRYFNETLKSRAEPPRFVESFLRTLRSVCAIVFLAYDASR